MIATLYQTQQETLDKLQLIESKITGKKLKKEKK